MGSHSRLFGKILKSNLTGDFELVRSLTCVQRQYGSPRRHYSRENSREKFDRKAREGNRPNYYYTTMLASGGLIASLAAYKGVQAYSKDRIQVDPSSFTSQHQEIGRVAEKNGGVGSGERIFRQTEVAQHDSPDKGVWITYKGNVYDITSFVQHHPGGSHTIMMGAGGDVEPFWQTYTVHRAEEVQRLLSRYRIGKLAPEDQVQVQNQVKDENNPFANDPQRNPLLIVHSQEPFNAETPAKLLLPTYITPTEIFFVRNHLPVPEISLEDYSLSICTGSDGDPDNLKVLAEFTLNDLKTKFKPHSVDSVIQCSGNRRSDLKRLKEIKGLDWKVGAMGNARWTGVRLIDLLESLGIKDERFKHVQMEGLDCDMTGQSYAASISADLALDPNKNVILAYEMNGQPLTRDHGYPLRFIAPGVTGARNVKWLGKIILSNEESHGHWQRKDYKSFSPSVDMFNVEFDKSISIQETPVQSAICNPAPDETIVLKRSVGKVGEQTSKFSLPVKGYAYSGGGKMIIRVDVSIDGGSSWMTAKLEDVSINEKGLPDYSKRNTTYSWTRWSIDVPVPESLISKSDTATRQEAGASLEVLCRAFDSAYNSQPERPETVWNVRGVVNNSWHRIKLNLKVED